MAGTKALLFVLYYFLLVACNAQDLQSCEFDALYQLGDSMSDTGNLIREDPSVVFARLPYGQTFFQKPTGRCSNGLLMIDFFAKSAGIPFLDPYLNKDGTFTQGVNFAVAGATALPSDVLAKKGIVNPPTTSSLSRQLEWMSAHFNTTYSSPQECSEKLKKSLFMVGEIGGNDYNYPFLQGKTFEEVKALMPEVIQAIKDAVTRVIGYGATRVIVPGNFPIGCFPSYLTDFQTNDTSAYDKYHCLKYLNEFSMDHNKYLQQAIEQLRAEHPTVILVYADYYAAFIWLLDNAAQFGFDTNLVQKACCGVGGDYNYDQKRHCGLPDVPVCQNPDQQVSWDGIHLTQQAYKMMAIYLIDDISSKLQCDKNPDS
ncbi:hypothetical protein SLE2022_126020 [Rubroshorea leprosula]